jgi:hypothetical protein
MGMCLLILPLQSIVVLIRYRSMIPFMYLFLLVVLVGSRAIELVHPLARSGALPYGVIMNLAILAVTILGFVLSLYDKREKYAAMTMLGLTRASGHVPPNRRHWSAHRIEQGTGRQWSFARKLCATCSSRAVASATEWCIVGLFGCPTQATPLCRSILIRSGGSQTVTQVPALGRLVIVTSPP